MSIYRAWVPNKTGQLSFSQIGTLSNYSKASYRSIPCPENENQYLCVEKRTKKLDDSIFNIRDRLGRIFEDRKEIFFILDARCKKTTQSSQYLTGTIYCKYGDRGVSCESKSDITLLKQAFSVNFCLSRSGYCKFFSPTTVNQVSLAYSGKDPMLEYLTSQSYMFLRDMLHRHKHHNAKSDTFIDILKCETNWKNKIAYNLGKKVIRQPIINKPSTLQDSIGILAYLESFQASMRIGAYSKEHISSTRNSLNAEYIRSKDKQVSIRWVLGIVVTAYFFIANHIFGLNLDSSLDFAESMALTIGIVIILIALQISDIFDLKLQRVSLEFQKLLTYNIKVSILILTLMFFAGAWIIFSIYRYFP